jgi:hypothetical protein
MRKGTGFLTSEAGRMRSTAMSLFGSGLAPVAEWLAARAGDDCGDGATIASDAEPSLQHVP